MSAAVSRRYALREIFGATGVVLAGGGLVSVLASCSQPASVPTPTAAPNALVKPRASGAELTAVLASSELALGRNRMAIGLLDARNQAIADGSTRLELFKIQPNNTADKRAEAAAVFRTVGGASKGVWVSSVAFNEVGPWGAQVTHERANEQPKVARLNFEVIPTFSAPGYDQPAPHTPTPTEQDVGGDTSHICSNSPPCALHKISIASALDSGQKPLVVVFATPALCTSATCAPELDAVVQLHGSYADRANFVHVEIYEYPFDGQRPVKAVEDWHLPSEPWAFVIDKAGVVKDRFEGAAPIEELEPALKAVLS